MIGKLRSAATGMLAQSLKIDTISNNIANVNTDGYKKSRISFQDLLYRRVEGSGEPIVPGGEGALQVGAGVRVVTDGIIFEQGVLRETGRDLDWAIEGEGFFRVVLPDNREVFTRVGRFYRDAEDNLVTQDGHLVEPLPEEVIYSFSNPQGLKRLGGNLWLATENSGEPLEGSPGEGNFGIVRQGQLESSNVSLLEEITSLIMAQRAYEISARTIRTADEMWGMANRMRR